MNDFTIVLRSLRARWFSTLTTIVTVAVAVALIVVLLTLRNSGKASFERGAGDMHLLVSGEASSTVAVLNNVFYANPPRRPLPWSRFEQLQAQAPWEYAIPTAIGDSFRAFPVVATTPEFFSAFKPAPGETWRFAEGAAFTNDFEIVLGSAVARRTGLKVGDTIYLTHGWSKASQGATTQGDADRAGVTHDDDDEASAGPGGTHVHREFGYKVVGVLEPTLTSHDRALFSSLQSSWLMHAQDRREADAKGEVAQSTPADLIDDDKKITAALLRLISRDASDTPANLPQVFDQLRRDGTLTVASPSQEIKNLFEIIDQVNRVFLAIAIVVLVSSAISIMLALYNSMEQRRRQIAVLRVLGASQGRIFNLTLVECAVIGLFGAVLGIILAYVGAGMASGVLRQRFGLIIEPSIAPTVIVILLAVTTVLAMLAGLVPAIMAYRTSVARNLRPVA